MSLLRISIVLAIALSPIAVFASEIREFDLETVKRLGAELARLNKTPEKGATTPERKHARDTAIAALKGKLFKIPYKYVVLEDPDGSGFLVYALAYSNSEIILGGHFRVTVSADGSKAERVDALSNTLLRQPPAPKGYKGEKPIGVSMSQIVSNRPLETCVYTSLHDKVIVSVGMVNDNAKVWTFVGDKIFEVTPELEKQLGIQKGEHK
ncbi:MAG: hypothetical protein QOG48_652 [Verrucomicrobiota bacterium]|jgi:hypothetical protein